LLKHSVSDNVGGVQQFSSLQEDLEMKETLALIASIVLVIALTGSSNFIAAQSSTPYTQKQPHMSSALDRLREPQRSLEAATHDKGGQRAKALKLVKEAIAK